MQVRVQFKDPDFAVNYDGKWTDMHRLPEDVQMRLFELGIGEYVTIKIDTDTGDTRVVPFTE